MNTRWLTSTVFGIGMASLLSDLSHEAVTSVLPTLLVSVGFAAGALGTIEGVADGLSSAAKLYGGWWSDRLHRRKPLCAFGYGAMAVVNGTGDFVSSVSVGWLWAAYGPAVGFSFALALMSAGALVVWRSRSPAPER